MARRTKSSTGFLRLLLVLPAVLSVFVAVEARSSEATENVKLNHEINNHQDSLHSHAGITSDSIFNTTTICNALQELHNGLETLQAEYFDLSLGKWPMANDWISAVMGSHISAALNSLSHSVAYTMPGTFNKDRKLDVEAQRVENEINRYFSHSIAFYFGEEAFSIRMQAYDDMLWVVLGWLDSIRFIEEHSERHYPSQGQDARKDSKWHAHQFNPSFAHRARIFYELAAEGWDTRLCGGGMLWSPRLEPYKNAITNELFIAASISMYLNFPGDDDCSPFAGAKDNSRHQNSQDLPNQKPINKFACGENKGSSTYDPAYLEAAVTGYKWLNNSGMKNEQGLYTDGFHIKNFRDHTNTKCDQRTESVWTYNQGVILSGLRGLWEATGTIAYLEEGHELIRSVIRATGWSATQLSPTICILHKSSKPDSSQLPLVKPGEWGGMGVHGILTETCDPSGTCDQDGQAFKSIFFLHLTAFCAPLPRIAVAPGKTYSASRESAALHRASCDDYAPWVVKNAQAALKTRDENGRFGMWWGAGDGEASNLELYRDVESVDELSDSDSDPDDDSAVPFLQEERGSSFTSVYADRKSVHGNTAGDLNDRGRGRTVETQGGGVAVTRAMWEFLRNLESVERG